MSHSPWELSGAADHLVSEVLYCRDPEGNGVEIYRDRPQSAWEATPDGGVRIPTEPLDTVALEQEATDRRAMPVRTDVGHVHLEVSDLDDARAFYADALGITVRETVDGTIFLAAGDYHHHLGVNVWQGRSAPASGRGLDWFELESPSESVVKAARERPMSHGYAVETTDAGARVTDPDGIELRLRA